MPARPPISTHTSFEILTGNDDDEDPVEHHIPNANGVDWLGLAWLGDRDPPGFSRTANFVTRAHKKETKHFTFQEHSDLINV